jgi:polyisoprenyl-teichoic acid--peptidoglycan teichoic acid transferase
VRSAALGGWSEGRPLASGSGRRILWLLIFGLVFGVVGAGLALVYSRGHRLLGNSRFSPIAQTRDFYEIAVNPQEAFSGHDRINILCLGLDRNWTRKGMPYTKEVRSDTMIVVSLDLPRRKAYALSVPRDLRVEIPDHGHSRINDAHRFGGIALTIETVQNFLGVHLDYYAIVKLGAVRRLVDAVGGIDVEVEKDMDYDDNWGQLHIHLKQGPQHLSGEEIEGYMRFRHDNEGDFGRMRRQQQVFRTISKTLKSPVIVFKFDELLTVLEQNLDTNLSRKQLMALGRMFSETGPDDLVTETVPAENSPRNGIAYLEVLEEPKEALVDWLLHGNAMAEHRLIDVELLNGCRSQTTTEWVRELLTGQEFPTRYRGRADRGNYAITRIIDHGRHPGAARRVLETLASGELSFDKRSWGPAVTVIVGADLRDHPDSVYSSATASRETTPAPVTNP